MAQKEAKVLWQKKNYVYIKQNTFKKYIRSGIISLTNTS